MLNKNNHSRLYTMFDSIPENDVDYVVGVLSDHGIQLEVLDENKLQLKKNRPSEKPKTTDQTGSSTS